MSSLQNPDQATTTVTLPIKGTRFIYKCRFCGKNFYSTRTRLIKDDNEALNLLLDSAWGSTKDGDKPEIAPALAHTCQTKTETRKEIIGLGDLVATELEN